MKIAYYVTSHGYGHGVRTCAICNEFTPNVHVTFRTSLPENFFREEVYHEFAYAKGEFDCGCLQTDGVTVDIEKTLHTYKAIADKNKTVLVDEVRWLKENKFDGVVSDITPFAFEAAKEARIPSVAVTNFTWYDIYNEYTNIYPDFSPYLEKIRSQYESADLALAIEPALPMSYFLHRKAMPVTGRAGANVRENIENYYGISSVKKIGLIYIGNFGMNTALWKNLEQFTNWEFLGVYPLPHEPKNFHLINKKDFRYQDLSASVDLVVGKIGYGTYSECVLNGTPLLFLPREDFAEYPSLEHAALQWGGGHIVSHDEFYNLQWDAVLKEIELHKPIQSYQANGARLCAREIESFVQQ